MPDTSLHHLKPQENEIVREMIGYLEDGHPTELVVQETLKTGLAETRIRELLDTAIRVRAEDPSWARSIGRGFIRARGQDLMVKGALVLVAGLVVLCWGLAVWEAGGRLPRISIIASIAAVVGAVMFLGGLFSKLFGHD